jgi:uncharacterized protein YndB with AHSA1/START domain
MAHPFKVTDEFEVDATPEDVWQAIATGPGVDAWFMGNNEIQPGEGGTTRMATSAWTEEGTITAWEPPNRFEYRTPEAEDGATHAFEYLVEGRDTGSTVVRWVHSGFLGANWEKEYEGLSEGDPMYFDKLRIYLTYFRGRTATPVAAFGDIVVPDREEAWTKFHRALGLSSAPKLGDQVRLTPEGLPQLDGEVDWLYSPSLTELPKSVRYKLCKSATSVGPIWYRKDAAGAPAKTGIPTGAAGRPEKPHDASGPSGLSRYPPSAFDALKRAYRAL